MNQDPRSMLRTYFALMNANGSAHVYRMAIETGVLDALGEAPATAAEVSRRCGLAARPTYLLLRVMTALGIVARCNGHFTLTPLAELLIAGSYRHLGDEYWSGLEAYLREGHPTRAVASADESSRHYASQAMALAWMLGPCAAVAAETLEIGTARRDLSILDLGAGSAVWSLAMARRDPGATVTAVDRPAVLEIAARCAARAGVADRFSACPGDLRDIELPPDAFDLVVLANVAHLLTPEENESLLCRARAALRPNGELAIFDVFPGQEEGDLNRELYALGLALRSSHGRVYEAAELEQILTRVGFASPTLTQLRVPPSTVGMLLAGRDGSRPVEEAGRDAAPGQDQDRPQPVGETRIAREVVTRR